MVWTYTTTSNRKHGSKRTDRKIEANEPNITIKKFEENICIMIDVTVLADKNISLKEFQKLSK